MKILSVEKQVSVKLNMPKRGNVLLVATHNLEEKLLGIQLFNSGIAVQDLNWQEFTDLTAIAKKHLGISP